MHRQLTSRHSGDLHQTSVTVTPLLINHACKQIAVHGIKIKTKIGKKISNNINVNKSTIS